MLPQYGWIWLCLLLLLIQYSVLGEIHSFHCQHNSLVSASLHSEDVPECIVVLLLETVFLKHYHTGELFFLYNTSFQKCQLWEPHEYTDMCLCTARVKSRIKAWIAPMLTYTHTYTHLHTDSHCWSQANVISWRSLSPSKAVCAHIPGLYSLSALGKIVALWCLEAVVPIFSSFSIHAWYISCYQAVYEINWMLNLVNH